MLRAQGRKGLCLGLWAWLGAGRRCPCVLGETMGIVRGHVPLGPAEHRGQIISLETKLWA